MADVLFKAVLEDPDAAQSWARTISRAISLHAVASEYIERDIARLLALGATNDQLAALRAAQTYHHTLFLELTHSMAFRLPARIA